jgi:hypothetical protein
VLNNIILIVLAPIIICLVIMTLLLSAWCFILIIKALWYIFEKIAEFIAGTI